MESQGEAGGKEGFRIFFKKRLADLYEKVYDTEDLTLHL